jgi:hypothetical protein
LDSWLPNDANLSEEAVVVALIFLACTLLWLTAPLYYHLFTGENDWTTIALYFSWQ